MRLGAVIGLAAASALWLVGCLSFDPPAGHLACGSGDECPDGWICAADRRCYPNDTDGLDGGTPLDDGSVVDGGETDAGCPDEPCRLVAPQCGCPSGRGCYPNSDGTEVSCAPAGTTGEGQACSGLVNSCQPGLFCVNYPGASSLCIRVCEADSDCAGGAGSFCALDLSADYRACTFSCDIMAQTCAEGFRCEPGAIAGAGPSRIATDCVPIGSGQGTGSVGETCSSFRDCEPGLTCASGQCLSFCRFATECPSGAPCSELSPSIEIDGLEYGVCPP